MPYAEPSTAGLAEMLQEFGIQLRHCRLRAGLSQARLSELSGVTQSTISRIERGKAPRAGIAMLVQLGEVLGYRLPLGFCPHEHICGWQRVDAMGIPREPSAPMRHTPWLSELLEDEGEPGGEHGDDPSD